MKIKPGIEEHFPGPAVAYYRGLELEIEKGFDIYRKWPTAPRKDDKAASRLELRFIPTGPTRSVVEKAFSQSGREITFHDPKGGFEIKFIELRPIHNVVVTQDELDPKKFTCTEAAFIYERYIVTDQRKKS